MKTKELIRYHLIITFFQNGLPLHGVDQYDCEEWDRVQGIWRGVCNNPSVTKCWITLARECRGINEKDEVCSFDSESETLLMYERVTGL